MESTQCVRAGHRRVADPDGEVAFGLANELRAFDQAFRLVHDQYVRRGYTEPHPSGRRITDHHRLPSTRVFVAEAGREVIGTVTLIEDSTAGLPMDEIYREELAQLRTATPRIAEVSALAADSQRRPAGVGVLMGLMRVLVIYAAEFARLDHLCIAVNPRHVPFYTTVLQFRQFGPRKAFPKVNGAPAVALHLELGFVRNLIRIGETGYEFADEVYRFFFGRPNVRDAVYRLATTLPGSILKPSQLAALVEDAALRIDRAAPVSVPAGRPFAGAIA
ncbi:MAG TPA: hypothetical protein VNO23_04125 [Candidatus Binatia bacterium]|nr:hypothetical protein [Candidatus Binatia bacterium]